MNKRIQELMSQAGTDVSGKWMGVDHAAKFAELIVRDVLVICDAVSEPFGDLEMDKNVPGALVVAEMVRENFGVEE